jgi:hypothetical protein
VSILVRRDVDVHLESHYFDDVVYHGLHLQAHGGHLDEVRVV